MHSPTNCYSQRRVSFRGTAQGLTPARTIDPISRRKCSVKVSTRWRWGFPMGENNGFAHNSRKDAQPLDGGSLLQ
jgi:hypothetical protein